MKNQMLVILAILFLSAGMGAASGKEEATRSEAEGGITAAEGPALFASLAEYEKLTGRSITTFSEAPMLKELVTAGRLPPLEERLPEEPMVVQSYDEIGRYGGTLRGPALGPATSGHDLWTARAQHLFTIAPDLRTIAPNIAKGWDISADNKALTIYLRKGMKWSDGAPFTTDDVMFWYEDIIMNDELTPAKPTIWSPGGQVVQVQRIDDYTARFDFAAPYPPIIDILSVRDEPIAPKHFLKKWHIRYNDKAGDLARQEGYDNWYQAFAFHNMDSQPQQDIDRPFHNPWVLKSIDTSGNKYYERNPYYYKIDTAGNQLPYIDRQARLLVENREVEQLKVISGEFDFAGNHLTLENYTLFKEGEQKGAYTTLLFTKTVGANVCFSFEFNHKDPVLRQIFNNLKFREAMSLAIDRDEINKILYYGKGVPRQATVEPDSPLYEDWMGDYLTGYEPDRANQLLDEIGLKWDKDHKFRLRPDGKPLTVSIEYAQVAGPRGKTCELVAGYWQKVGVNAVVKEETRSLYQQRGRAGDRDLGVWGFNDSDEFTMRTARCKRYMPPWSAGGNPLSGIHWWNWYNTQGASGEEPPQYIKDLFDLCDEWLTKLPGTDEYIKLGKEILTINTKQLFVISTIGLDPWPIIVNSRLKNTPKTGTFGWDKRFWLPYMADQWFYAE